MRSWKCLLLVMAFGLASAKLGKVPLPDPGDEAQLNAFNQADADGSGELNLEEHKVMFASAMKAAGQDPEDIMKQHADSIALSFQKIDTDGSGGISFAEYMEMVNAGVRRTEAAQKEKEDAQLKGVFEPADENKDGKLSKDEMWNGFNKYGYDKKQVDSFFELGDRDKDGHLTLEEFKFGRAAMQSQKELETMMEGISGEEEQRKAFTEADTNGDGTLSLIEHEKVFMDYIDSVGGDKANIDPKTVVETFNHYDTDKSGGITMEEWIQALKKQLEAMEKTKSAQQEALNNMKGQTV